MVIKQKKFQMSGKIYLPKKLILLLNLLNQQEIILYMILKTLV
jgi:hypothetical protein